MKKLSDINRHDDEYSLYSKEKLKKSTAYKMKEIYKAMLDYAELTWGRDAEGFDTLRSKVLGVGNDKIRQMEDEIDEFYNIEFIPQTITMKVKEKELE